MAAPFDTERPHPARVYDYMLGGKDNFAVDRAAAEAGLKVNPNAATAPLHIGGVAQGGAETVGEQPELPFVGVVERTRPHGGDLQRADDGVAGEQRGDRHRPDPQQPFARIAVDPRVGAGVGAVRRLPGGHDRAAERPDDLDPVPSALLRLPAVAA